SKRSHYRYTAMKTRFRCGNGTLFEGDTVLHSSFTPKARVSAKTSRTTRARCGAPRQSPQSRESQKPDLKEAANISLKTYRHWALAIRHWALGLVLAGAQARTVTSSSQCVVARGDSSS